ncbi:transposable element Tcb1 transposase [Trichonephila clavipes]|nr:transposable element Tcb1 transposase [Trichonephila clavipes]
MFGDHFAKELQPIPLSNGTVSRRIDDIAEDVEQQLFDEETLKEAEKFRDGLFLMKLSYLVHIFQKLNILNLEKGSNEGTMDRRGRSHPPQCTTSREDRQIARMALRNRSITSRIIAQHIQSIAHHSMSARTIRHRLQQSGLSARQPLLCVPLTQNHGRLHRQL